MNNNSGKEQSEQNILQSEQGAALDMMGDENFFEKQGMMPNANKTPNNLRQIGSAAIGDGANSLNGVESYNDNEKNMNVGDVEGGSSVKEYVRENRSFSNNKEFTKSDGEITEEEIRKLREDPAAAYEDFQHDKEAYLKNAFGRVLGEQK